jgi:hypothetical protein
MSRITHIQQRAIERYNLELTQEDIKEIDRFACLLNTGKNAELAIPFRGEWIAVGFNPSVGVMTCLPKSVIDKKMKIRALKVQHKLEKENKPMPKENVIENLRGLRARLRRDELEAIKNMHNLGKSIEEIALELRTFPKNIKKVVEGTYIITAYHGKKSKPESSEESFESIEAKLLNAAQDLIMRVNLEETAINKQIAELEAQRAELKESINYKKALILVRNEERFKLNVPVS